MFTVLIAEKEYIDAIRKENKLFFEPFLDSRDIAFCCWNPQGQNIHDSVPELPEVVGRKKNWRAVIINDCNTTTSKSRNPFDMVEHSTLDAIAVPTAQPQEGESAEEWEGAWKEYYDTLTLEKEKIYKSALERPLPKLATWLCFRPEDYILNDVQEKQDANDWAMKMISGDVAKHSTKLEMFEREQYKRELRIKENLRRMFIAEQSLNINYPSEVYCVSTRTMESNNFDPDAYWNIYNESQYSVFADLNMYFDRMRFMVFDILSPAHRDFRSDYIRFLASVLIIASNPIPSSAMKARRLYKLEVETDDEPLCILATSYDKKLSNTYDVIESEMERIRSEIPGELTDKAAEDLFCTPQDIAVLPDASCTLEKAFAESDYGLFFDSPEDEFHKWNREYDISKNELTYIAKQGVRSVQKGIHQMHLSSKISDANISRLTPMQVDDVREYTNAAENDLIASIPSDFTDINVCNKRIEEASKTVKKTIARRMTRKTAAVLSMICLLLFLISFLPFIVANNETSQETAIATAFTLASIVILAVIMILSLFVMRLSLVNAVKDYNDTVRQIINDIHSSMKQASKYLSAVCNVRRGYTVQNYSRKNVDEYTRNLRVRKKHKEEIRKIRAQLAEDYSDYLGDSSYCDKTMAHPYDYDFEQTTEYLYPAPFLVGNYRQIEFISTGNLVTIPLAYVTRILVRMEDIYEK